ncbi:hypothetical protein [Bradyrhizobium sp. BR 10289]|uniref:hypothetical protein n=1 Tax=Bradyrhizobium sp. BR 10289 TaxID=2749993 RepID=UPI001C6479E3|nr:hypothetical protein [Bradyrhizobium sp. BR 10289]MBW7971871.1 hypothetical protein [Bradyrhizobium sp. BR 10289]
MRFVYIDDEPDPAVAEALGRNNVSVFQFAGNLDDQMDDLIAKIRDCSVVIVDLKLAEHRVDDEFPSALYPQDGLALKEILTSILTERASQLESGVDATAIDVEPKTTAFVLYSGELDLLGDGVPARGREHVIARKVRGEWAMSKNPRARPTSQIDLRVLQELADGVDAVSQKPWGEALEREDALKAITELLDLDRKSDWAATAERQIFENRPPLQSLANRDGISLLRWMLHIALPYPSFLLDSVEVSLLCRLQPEWGVNALESKGFLADLFSDSLYRGLLSNFLGARWWRAGVVAKLRQITGGVPHSIDRLRSYFDQMHGKAVPMLNVATPVRTVDEEFRLTNEIVDVDEAVRLEPEEWPLELAPPWIALSKVAKSPRLRRYVLERDIDRVQSFLTATRDDQK